MLDQTGEPVLMIARSERKLRAKVGAQLRIQCRAACLLGLRCDEEAAAQKAAERCIRAVRRQQPKRGNRCAD